MSVNSGGLNGHAETSNHVSEGMTVIPLNGLPMSVLTQSGLRSCFRSITRPLKLDD